MILKAHSALPFADVPIELLSTLRHSFLVHVRGRSCSAGSRQECRKSSRFETRPTVGTAQPCINIAGWPVAPFLLISSYGPQQAARQDSSAHGLGPTPSSLNAAERDSRWPRRPGTKGRYRTINA